MGRIWLSIVFVCYAAGLLAQQNSSVEEGVGSTPPPASVLTLDVDRLFTQSEFGLRILDDYNTQGAALASENRRIADALRAEEAELARQRPDMALEVFVSEAEAFDEKAQAIRRAQDAKERELEVLLTEGRNRFLEVTRPILGELMFARGATAILDRRSVLLFAASIDVTDDAIERINATLGDGLDPQTPSIDETLDVAD